jgi:hypothetical protein
VVLLGERGGASLIEAPNVAGWLRDGDDDDDGGAVSATTGHDGRRWAGWIYHTVDWRGRGRRRDSFGAVWWPEGYVDMSAVQNLSLALWREHMKREARPSW